MKSKFKLFFGTDICSLLIRQLADTHLYFFNFIERISYEELAASHKNEILPLEA